MALDKRQNLMKYAEEVAYSSKGHFKAADWTKMWTQLCIGVPILLSVVLIVYQTMDQALSRFLNCASMIFSILALMSPLVSNQDQACKKTDEHMNLGNAYLDLYTKIRNFSTEDAVTMEHIEEIAKIKRELDAKSNSLRISFIPRWWSKLRINKEMDLGWIYEK
jgi:hypothetical protein